MTVVLLLLLGAWGTTEGRQNLGTTPQQGASNEATGSLSGVVVDATSGEPLSGALVTLSPGARQRPGQFPAQLTDQKGRFLFSGVLAYDRFVLGASKIGYFDGKYGWGNVAAFVELKSGQWLRDLTIRLARPAVITGVVRDEGGQPIVGGYVRALARVRVAGSPQLAVGRPARTDDRGVYRIPDLAPGSYYLQFITVQAAFPVTATLDANTPASSLVGESMRHVVSQYPVPARLRDGRQPVYVSTFFPASRDLQAAQLLDLSSGDERSGIDLAIRGEVAGIISGTVVGAPEAVRGLPLRLLVPGLEGLGDGGEVATTIADTDGHFTFVNVPTGSYVILGQRGTAELRYPMSEAVAQLPRGPGVGIAEIGSGASRVSSGPENMWIAYRGQAQEPYWIHETVSTSGEAVKDGVVRLRRGSTVTGRYVWEGARPSTPSGPTGIAAEPVDGTLPLTPRRARDTSRAGDFVIEGLPPGRFVLRMAGSAAASALNVKSVVCGNKDFTYVPFETTDGGDLADCVVTVTDKSATIQGTTTRKDGSPALDAAVVVFPVEQNQRKAWGFNPERHGSVQASQAGIFKMDNLPAGDYLLAAVPRQFSGCWQDEDCLARLAPSATRIRVEWGAVVERALVVTPLTERR